MPGTLMRFVLFLLVGVVLNGCTASDVMFVSPEDFDSSLPMKGASEAAILATGDTIEISVEVDGRIEVPLYQASINHNGFVTLPLVGDVEIAGVSFEVARLIISNRYSAYYVSKPVVMLSPANQSDGGGLGQVSVMGKVRNPGPVPLASGSGIRLSAAIQTAGGFAPSAKTSEIQITRIDQRGRKLRVVVDFDKIGAAGDAQADIQLKDGDIVNIPERIW